MDSLEAIIASVLRIPIDAVTEGLAYDAIPEWDSMNHVNLMLALESRYGRPIDEDRMVELTTVAAIRRFVEQP